MMIVLTFCLRRLPHLEPAEFHRYWLESHGPLVRSHLKAIRAVRYMQLHALQDPVGDAVAQIRGAPTPYDGIAQMWWASRADLDASMQAPEARAAGRAMLEDERRFIDLPRSPIWINTLYDYPAPAAD
jgi:uncharacterized protein (TIGR02118 family)